MTTANQTAPSPAVDAPAEAPAEAPVSAPADAPAVLAEISGMLRTMLDEYGLDDIEITMETRFTEDLELESIDLVTLAGSLEARYGRQVNFAEFVADLELDEIIDLTVGRLVEYVVRCLRAARER
ncbi:MULTISPECIES: acyl carrier protein [Streptomyces violaceusniger group]|uniref:acyl carrier protein n=1 Tax=Streptomyces violaceusniger group TaxID=2839105 RepID=UPI0033753102